MRTLFIVVIVFGLLCLLLLVQRRKLTRHAMLFRGRRKRSLQLLLGQSSPQRRDAFWRQAGRLITQKVARYCSVLEPHNKPAFLRNVLIPTMICLATGLVNMLYINLPASWLLTPTIPIVFTVWHAMLAKKKQKQFNENFMEALTSIGGAVSAGRTFAQAMQDYSFTSSTPLGAEFGRVSRRLNLGESPEQVFNDSWKRYPYRQYYFFIVAVLLNISSGGRLKEVLAKLQRAIASSVATEKKMLTMTSEMRMSAKITGAIPFVFLILLKFISPENFDFVLYDQKGNYILYYLLGSEILGIAVIRFLMRGV
ncbi:type II secretion system F family protein [Pantoea sp. CCBC3-3-1]|uniref:type II secretion system F family protein n=1 Tax=Pantoea sp. CCBC3-3-1 TaxID=2490851 RepID=UPI0011BE676B|nr:type II secretion system F family protein [Pantoea sp. CCBC3-3-1]